MARHEYINKSHLGDANKRHVGVFEFILYLYVSNTPLTRSRQTFHSSAAAELNQVTGGATMLSGRASGSYSARAHRGWGLMVP